MRRERAAQQGAASDTKQLATIDLWYRSGGGRGFPGADGQRFLVQLSAQPLGSGTRKMLRIATSSDIAGIRALLRSVPGMWQESWRGDVLEIALSSAGNLALVHEDRHSIDGFACAHDVGFRAYLSELVVAPEAQREGVGSQLLSEIERRLIDRGCSVIIADAWRDAEPFYRSLGWSSPSVVFLRKSLGRAAA